MESRIRYKNLNLERLVDPSATISKNDCQKESDKAKMSIPTNDTGTTGMGYTNTQDLLLTP
jgi:hypothetical protein